MDIGSDYWYGGPEELVQRSPLQPANSRDSTPFLPGDMLQVLYISMNCIAVQFCKLRPHSLPI